MNEHEAGEYDHTGALTARVSSTAPPSPESAGALDLGAHLVDLAAASEELEWLRRQGADFDQRATAPATRRAYDGDWAMFQAWCDRHGLPALPAAPETVRLYATDLAIQVRQDGQPRFKVASIRRYLAAIGRVHYDAGHGRDLIRHAAVSNLMAGISRVRLERPERRRPLLLDDIANMLEPMERSTWPAGIAAARDAFILLFGFATALRRSEVAALTVGDLTYQPLDGLHVRLGRSKADQEGRGATLAVPFGTHATTCPVCAWVRWGRLLAAAAAPGGGRAALMGLVLAASDDPESQHVCRGDLGFLDRLDPRSPLLRPVTRHGEVGEGPVTDAALGQMVKRRLAAAGYDPTPYGFHSLRAGFVTQARRNGADARSVRRQTRHSSDGMVDVYDREHLPLEGNAVRLLGL